MVANDRRYPGTIAIIILLGTSLTCDVGEAFQYGGKVVGRSPRPTIPMRRLPPSTAVSSLPCRRPQSDRSAAAVTTSTVLMDDSLAVPRRERFKIQLRTLLRVGVPPIIAGGVATLLFPALVRLQLRLFSTVSASATDYAGQFLSVMGLLYSLLVGQTYSFVYSQQEALYYALYNEVTEAKSLLEQVALVCQGRAMYPKVLRSISSYVSNDLKNIRTNPAILLSSRPVDDPLESLMYLTSVGVPGQVYETIRSLRQARAARLGALQRKVPGIHMFLLWTLAAIMLAAFPVLGASTASGVYTVRTVEGCLFGIMAFGITLTKALVGELLRPAGGAYNVDAALGVMVKGLEAELSERLSGRKNDNAPSIPNDFIDADDDDQ